MFRGDAQSYFQQPIPHLSNQISFILAREAQLQCTMWFLFGSKHIREEAWTQDNVNNYKDVADGTTSSFLPHLLAYNQQTILQTFPTFPIFFFFLISLLLQHFPFSYQ